MFVNACLWLVFFLIVAVGVHPSYPPGSIYHFPMALVALAGAGTLFALAELLRRRGRAIYWASVGLLAALILAGVFDQVGLADLAFMAITLVPLALLIRNRKWYLQPSVHGKDGEGAA